MPHAFAFVAALPPLPDATRRACAARATACPPTPQRVRRTAPPSAYSFCSWTPAGGIVRFSGRPVGSRQVAQRAAGLAGAAPASRPVCSASGDAETAPLSADISLVRVELKKPMGMVLEEADDGNVFVASVVAGGAAEQAGVRAGDVISKVMGTFIIDSSRGKFESKLVDAKGMKLKTVMDAITSNDYLGCITCSDPDRKVPTAFVLERRG
eukprot:tig00000480_g1332.t1